MPDSCKKPSALGSTVTPQREHNISRLVTGPRNLKMPHRRLQRPIPPSKAPVSPKLPHLARSDGRTEVKHGRVACAAKIGNKRRTRQTTRRGQSLKQTRTENGELRATTTDGASLEFTREQPETRSRSTTQRSTEHLPRTQNTDPGTIILQVERLPITAPPGSLLSAKPQGFAWPRITARVARAPAHTAGQLPAWSRGRCHHFQQSFRSLCF